MNANLQQKEVNYANDSTGNMLPLALMNLIIVVVLGSMMRYKMAFHFPFFEQKNLQLAHSHFAFFGWITYVLIGYMIHYIRPATSKRYFFYKIISWINLISAYGMLVSFMISGYSGVSIFFSTIAMLNTYCFAILFIHDWRSDHTKRISGWYFVTALLYLILSSLGVYFLGYIMATGSVNQHLYLAALYFFLHFQYNGWFLMACMGIWQDYLERNSIRVAVPRYIHLLLMACVLPTYLLSILWMNLPNLLYIIMVLAAIIQFAAWSMLFADYLQQSARINQHFNRVIKIGLWGIGIALTIKFGLQLVSVVPQVSKITFGFRPIVIAYLHLVLLAIISFFLLLTICIRWVPHISQLLQAGILILGAGIYLTEIWLAIQGILSMHYFMLPYSAEVLFMLTLIMVTGVMIIAFSILGKR